MDASGFSFRRFITLLARTLEVSAITAFIVRSLVFVVWWQSNLFPSTRLPQLARIVLDDASLFFLLSILLLLLLRVFLLIAQGRCAIFSALRAFAYLVLFCLSPYPLGDQQPHAGPNQSLQLTAGRRESSLDFMKHIVDVAKARFRQR